MSDFDPQTSIHKSRKVYKVQFIWFNSNIFSACFFLSLKHGLKLIDYNRTNV